MARERDVLRGIDLTGNQYTTKQSFIRNKYRVYDAQGNHLLTTKQKLFRMKEEFPFKDANGNHVFTVKAQSVLDIAGDYSVIEAGSDDVLAVLSKNFTFVHHKWEVKDPQGNVQAVIKTENKVVNALRAITDIADLIPHSYTIETPDGHKIGEIKGKFSIRDTYELRIDDTTGMPKEALVAAAIAVDALEGN